MLALHAELARIARPDRRRAVIDALDRVGLADRADDPVSTFSKGMQQRLGLGVALLGDPDLILLDEPTSALDPVGRMDVRAIVRAARDRGATVILNSHLLTEVERVCDRDRDPPPRSVDRIGDARRGGRRGRRCDSA